MKRIIRTTIIETLQKWKVFKVHISKLFQSFSHFSARQKYYSLLSYRVAGGCKAPRAGIDSVCCSQPGESPPHRLLKKKIMKKYFETKISDKNK